MAKAKIETPLTRLQNAVKQAEDEVKLLLAADGDDYSDEKVQAATAALNQARNKVTTFQSLFAGNGSEADDVDLDDDGDVDLTPTNRLVTNGRVNDIADVRVTVKDKYAALRKDPKGGFRNAQECVGMMVRDAIAINENPQGFRRDPRVELMYLNACDTCQSSKAAISGGATIPQGFTAELLMLSPDVDERLFATRRIPMELPSMTFLARVDKDHRSSVSGGLFVTRKPEDKCVPSATMKLDKIKLDTNPMFGLVCVPRGMANRSPISIGALIQSGMRDEYRSERVRELLYGTGLGEYLGVTNSPAKIVIDRETVNIVTITDLVNMISHIWNYDQAIWIAGHSALPSLYKINMAAPNCCNLGFVPDASGFGWGTLMGRPLGITGYAAGVAETNGLMLVNFMEVLEGELTGNGASGYETSIHAQFECHNEVFKFWVENDAKPWWNATYIPPKDGANELSPYVFLSADVAA